MQNPDIISLDLDKKLKESSALSENLGEVCGCKMESSARHELCGRAVVDQALELIAWHQALLEAARDTLKEQKKAESEPNDQAREGLEVPRGATQDFMVGWHSQAAQSQP